MNRKLIKFEEHIRKVETPQGSATIISKLKLDRVEVNVYEIKRGFTLYFQPPKIPGAIKIYWVLKGQLNCINEQYICGQGSMVVLRPGDEPYHIHSIEDTQVLLHSVDDESFSQTEKTFNHIYGVLQQIQEKDSYTLDHSYNVHRLTEKLGTALGYSGNRLLNLLLSAQYHDVGKIEISDTILNKPDKLDPDEFEIMKKHVTVGEPIILENFSDEVYDIIAQHHERYDGSGYPKGLKGEAIRHEARILAICDSYDAMISKRVYKIGKSPAEALLEIEKLAGTLYDPQIVRVFVEIMKANDA